MGEEVVFHSLFNWRKTETYACKFIYKTIVQCPPLSCHHPIPMLCAASLLLSSRSSLLWSRVPHSSAIRWRIATNQVGKDILSRLLGGCFSLGSFVLGRSIVSSSETLSESSQLTGLVELHVSQRLLAGLPQESVSRILGRAVEGLRGGSARGVG